MTKEVAESIGLGKPTRRAGAQRRAGGPADKAGVEAGDIITKVDGKRGRELGDLPRIVGGIKPGSKATLQVFRRGSYRDIAVDGGRVRGRAAGRAGSAEPRSRRPRRRRARSASRCPT